ncbi:DUF3617 family protein [Sphingomonas sp. ASV193]
MRLKAILVFAGVSLAACVARSNDKIAHQQSVAKAVEETRNALNLKPGRWEMTFRMVPDPAQPVRPNIPQIIDANGPHTAALCLTSETIRSLNPAVVPNRALDCHYEHFAIGGGKLSGDLRCIDPRADRPDQTSQTIMNGTYNPEKLSVDLDRAEVRNGQRLHSRMETEFRYAGACRGDEISPSRR